MNNNAADKILNRAGRVEAWARLQVFGGALRRGDRLPSPETLATRFEVNVNTVREALSRLEADRLIEIRHGKGAFVTCDITPSRVASLRALLAHTLLAAEGLGLSASDTAMLITAYAREPIGRRVWLADTVHPYLGAFATQLSGEFQTIVNVLDLEGDFRCQPFPQSGDIVLTPLRSLSTTRSRYSESGAMILPLRVRLGGSGLVEIATLSAETRLCVLCVQDLFAEIMGRAVQRSGITFRQEHASIYDESALERAAVNSDAFVISTVARDRLEPDSIVRKFTPLVPLYFELDPESIRGVKDFLDRAA